MLLFKLCDIFFSNHLSHSLAAEWVCGLFPPQLFVLLKKGVDLSKMSKIRKLLEQQVSIHADWYQQNNQTKLSRKKKERERRKRTFTSSRSSGCTLWIIASVSESVRTRAIDTPASVNVFFLLWNFSIFHLLVVAAADIFRQCHQLFQTIGIHMTAVGLLRLYTKYLEWHSPVAGAKALCLQASFQSLANEVLNRQEVKIWAEIMFSEHLLRPCCAFWGRQQATRACSWESYKCKILFFDIPNTDVEHKICTYNAARRPHVPRAFASFPQLQRDVGPVHIDQVLVVHLQHQGGDLGEPAGKQVLDKVPCEQFHFVHLQNFIVCHGQKYT